MKKLLTTPCLLFVAIVAIVPFIGSTVLGPRTAAAKKPASQLVTGTPLKVIVFAVKPASSPTPTPGTTLFNILGLKRTIVLTLRSASSTPRCSNATMNSAVFTAKNSVSNYYTENSYGLVSVAGDVVGPYTIDVGSKCNRGKWASQADAAATAAGVNLSTYDNRLYIDPPEGDSLCFAGGLSDKGSPAVQPIAGRGRMWVSNKLCDSPHYIAHEMGHLFGEEHASTSSDAYGDASSVMGGNADYLENADLIPTSPHFNAPGKIAVGWLPASRVQTVTVGGSYKVAFLATASVGAQVLKIDKAVGPGDYYFSYRRAVGFDATLRPAYINNTSVHSWRGSSPSPTYLLANIGDGQSWTDGRVTVTQTKHDATYAYLTVSFSGDTTAAGRAQAPQAKVRELAAIEGDVTGWCLLPNRRVVLYSVNNSTFAYDIITKRRTLLGTDMHPQHVSPRGDRFAFSRSSEDHQGRFMWTMPIDPKTGTATGPAQRVSLREASHLRFSPDGTMVVYTAGPRPDSTWDVTLVAATGGAERVVANYPHRVNSGWSADGKWLYVKGFGSGSTPNRHGISIERVPTAGGRSELFFPAFSADYQNVVGVSPDGSVAFYQDNPRWFYYLTASGAAGEITVALPQLDDGWGYDFSLHSMRYTTMGQVENPGGRPTSKIYELDMSPILKFLAKP